MALAPGVALGSGDTGLDTGLFAPLDVSSDASPFDRALPGYEVGSSLSPNLNSSSPAIAAAGSITTYISFVGGFSSSEALALVNALENTGPGDIASLPDVRVTIDGVGGKLELRIGRDYSLYPGSQTWMGQGPQMELFSLTRVGDVWAGSILATEEIFFTVENGSAKQHFPEPEGKDDIGGGAQNSSAANGGSGSPAPTTGAPTAAMSSSTPGGPYAGFDEVVDVLFVYDAADIGRSAATIEAAFINGINSTNVALADVGAYAFRIREIDQHVWDAASGQNVETCDLLDDVLDPNDGEADNVWHRRNQVGADLIVVAVPQRPGAGCAATPFAPSPATADSNSAVVVRGFAGTLERSTRHELGHALGLGHYFDGTDCENGTSYACGYTWPNLLEASSHNDVCTTSSTFEGGVEVHSGPEGFSTIMSKINRPSMGGGNAVRARRINTFSDPNNWRMWTDVCSPGDPIAFTPTGTNVVSSQGKTANNARRIRETIDDVADYRAEVTPPNALEGAVVTSPTPGSSTGGTPGQTHIWQLLWTAESSPANDYWLEVYSPTTGAVFFDGAVSNTNGFVSTPVGELVGVRLWTNTSGQSSAPIWAYNDYRYDQPDGMIGCDEEVMGKSDHSCAQVCTESNGRILCNLNEGGNFDSELYALGPSVNNPGLYDFQFDGTTNDGTDFCCLYSDRAGNIDEIDLFGGPTRDFMVSRLSIQNQTSLDVEMRGYKDADILVGSDETDLDYSEYLRGYGANDLLGGDLGDDRLGGGYGADIIYGNEGLDVLWAGNDTAYDQLYGGEGVSFVCTRDGEDLLLGADEYDVSSLAHIYISQQSPNPVNPQSDANTPFSSCGNPSVSGIGTMGCGNTSLSTVPAECAAMGAPQ